MEVGKELKILAITTFAIACLVQSQSVNAGETVLSSVLTPTGEKNEKSLSRQGRSYYDQRYAAGRPLYDRLENDRSRCGRCLDDRYDRDDGYGRPGQDRYDDDRSSNHRPTYGNRYDRNKNYDNDEDDRRYSTDRRNNQKTNGTDDDNNTSDKKRPLDDKDSRPSSSRRGNDRDRNRYDDRDRYRPDYYDRFLRDPYRDRNYDRPYYEDPYKERRPLFERYPDRYDDGFAGRYDGYGYSGYKKPVYDDRLDRGGGYDDGYGGYGPGVGRGPHDSFRPWDETYRGQAGWDSGGRGYYFASGRPDSAPAPAWGRPEYVRPESTASGWQNVGYTGYRDQLEYRGSFGYPQEYGYRQDLGYGRPTGWQNVRSYRDQSGVNRLESRPTYNQPTHSGPTYTQDVQSNTYGQPNSHQANIGANGYQSSTTPGTSYLYEREDEKVTIKPTDVTVTTKTASSTQ